MMVMPGMKANPTPPPSLPSFLPKRRHLGGDLLCVQGAEIEAKGSMEKKEICHTQETKRGVRTPNRRALLAPLGDARLVPKRNKLYIRTYTQPTPMRRWSVHTHTQIHT